MPEEEPKNLSPEKRKEIEQTMFDNFFTNEVFGSKEHYYDDPFLSKNPGIQESPQKLKTEDESKKTEEKKKTQRPSELTLTQIATENNLNPKPNLPENEKLPNAITELIQTEVPTDENPIAPENPVISESTQTADPIEPEVEIEPNENLTLNEITKAYFDLTKKAMMRPSTSRKEKRNYLEPLREKATKLLKIQNQILPKNDPNSPSLTEDQKTTLNELSAKRYSAFMRGDYIETEELNDQIADLTNFTITPDSDSDPITPESLAELAQGTTNLGEREIVPLGEVKRRERLVDENMIVKNGEIYEINFVQNANIKLESVSKIKIHSIESSTVQVEDSSLAEIDEAIDCVFNSKGSGKIIIKEGGNLEGNIVDHQL
ncbi:MAG: hypothetical protein PHW50_01100 [Patescibacteria group bacterium]|nr:hypothetical protein [Patescibacteria group bacterium]